MTLRPIDIAGFTGGHADVGAGPVAVLLASPFSTMAVYRPAVEALARSFRVIAVELPGSGRWPALRARWGFDQYARWVEGMLDRLNLGPAVLVGHSHTGPVAMRVAIARPDLLASVVLADSVGAAGWRTVVEVLARCAACIPLEVRFIASLLDGATPNLLRHPGNLVRQLVNATRADARRVAPRVGVPTLLAWGAHDYVEPPSALARLARWMPAARVYVSTRGSHDWLIDRAGEFAAVVRAFAIASTGDFPTLPDDAHGV
jgi:pimeloyl-ACP methyl ester carboxylesterase